MPIYQFLTLRLETGGQAFRLTVFRKAQNKMAIYHLNVRYCSKSKGQSAQAKNEYINRLDKYHKRLDDLQFSGFGNMPKFAENNPNKFWQSSDIYERANARVCTEIVFALPRELNDQQQQELVQSFINSTVNTDRNKLPYSFAIHNDKLNNNPHCHLIFSERKLDGIERDEKQFFKRANDKNPEKGGAKKTADFRDREFIKAVRQTWREQANLALEKYGYTARIDERTYQEQGVEKTPRSRIDRVTWQELNRLERESEAVGRKIADNQQEITTEKANIAKNAQNGISSGFENKLDTKQIEKEKTSLNRNQGLSQAEFDRFLIENWLKPVQQIVQWKNKLEKIQEEIDRQDRDLQRIQGEYNDLTASNDGFLGLWQTRAQKAKITKLEDLYSQTEQAKIKKSAEYDDLNERIQRFDQTRLEPLRKQIAQMQADNPSLEMRNPQQLLSIQIEEANQWAKEKLEREQSQKRQISQRKDGLSL